MSDVNRYGLSRTIPSEIKRKIRQDCGFGCVKCGNAIYEYEHIEPEYVNAKVHEAKNIALLCPNCHSKVTRRLWSKETIKLARKNPFCLSKGFSKFPLDLSKNPMFIEVCGNIFSSISNIIDINDKTILSVKNPELNSQIPRISAIFFDNKNNEIASIINNEWYGNATNFDIETRANSIIIREKLGELNLVIKFKHPNIVIIDRLNFKYYSTNIYGNKNKFRIKTLTSELEVPSGLQEPKSSSFWISIKGNKIFIAANNLAKFSSKNSEMHYLSGYYEIDNFKIKLDKGRNLHESNSLKIQNLSGSDGLVRLSINFPQGKFIKSSLGENLNINSSCICGSGINFGSCCKIGFDKINNCLNSSSVIRTLYDSFIKDYNLKVHFSVKHHQSMYYINNNDKKVEFFFNPRMISVEVLANAFLFCQLKIEGLYIPEISYNDIRKEIILSLFNAIVNATVLSKMMRLGLETKFFHDILSNDLINNVRSNKSLEPKNISRIHIEAVKYVEFYFASIYASENERKTIENLYINNAINSYNLAKHLIHLININDPYNLVNLKTNLFRIVHFLNSQKIINNLGVVEDNNAYKDFLG